MRKINFRQPKYVFPLIIFVPVCFLAYFITDMVGANDDSVAVATDRINPELPNPNEKEMGDKLFEMQRRFSEDDAYTAIAALGEDAEDKESVDHAYTEDELNNIDAEMAERIRQQKQMEEMQKALADSRKHINSYSRSGYDSYGSGYGSSGSGYDDSDDDYIRQMESIQQRSMERQRMLENAFGYNQQDNEEKDAKRRQDSIAKAKEIERERNRPVLVIKSPETNSDKFNSVTNGTSNIDAPLIRAMIDQTTKAHEGTRIRFKLLDNISIKNVKLPKGTYLYGTVSGFGQQRVKAKITSILVGNKFIKVDLSVFDNDGMEGFYVPESAFRDFMKEAGSNTVQQNIQFDNNSGSGGISGESIALQALQNLYNSATSAVSANIRKNRAKIKYNTIVYLINSQEAR